MFGKLLCVCVACFVCAGLDACVRMCVFVCYVHAVVHILNNIPTCTHSAPLREIVIFTLSAPICWGKMPSELHRETRKAPRDSEVQSITQQHCYCPRAQIVSI